MKWKNIDMILLQFKFQWYYIVCLNIVIVINYKICKVLQMSTHNIRFLCRNKKYQYSLDENCLIWSYVYLESTEWQSSLTGIYIVLRLVSSSIQVL